MTHGSIGRVSWVLAIALLAGACSSKGEEEETGGDCSAFKACGGVLEGTYQIDSVCADGDGALALNARWQQASCRDAVKSASVSMTGTLSFANGSMTSNVTTSETWRGIYSAPCISEITGTSVPQVDKTQCLVTQSHLDQGDVFDSVVCTQLNNACECTLGYSATNTSAAPYSIMEATIVFSNGEPSADFCSMNNELTLRRAEPVTAVPLVITAHRP